MGKDTIQFDPRESAEFAQSDRLDVREPLIVLVCSAFDDVEERRL